MQYLTRAWRSRSIWPQCAHASVFDIGGQGLKYLPLPCTVQDGMFRTPARASARAKDSLRRLTAHAQPPMCWESSRSRKCPGARAVPNPRLPEFSDCPGSLQLANGCPMARAEIFVGSQESTATFASRRKPVGGCRSLPCRHLVHRIAATAERPDRQSWAKVDLVSFAEPFVLFHVLG